MDKRSRSWFRKAAKKRVHPLQQSVEQPLPPVADELLSAELHENLKTFQDLFNECSDVVFRQFSLTDDVHGLLIFIDGIVDGKLISGHALKPLLIHLMKQESLPITVNEVEEKGVMITQLSHVQKVSEALDGILSGNCLLMIDGQAKGLILNAKGGKRRGIEEPATEASIRGPREGFNENLRTNTGLLRNKIKTPALKTVPFKIGKRTRTDVVLAYIDKVADPAVIEEVTKRLNSIEIDGVLESGYIEELIEDNPYSPFPQMQYTERPDTVAAQLLEGRFAIFVDGTPFVLIGPITFWQLLQASEDYYERYLIGNALRWLRLFFLFIALLMPATYTALITYHHDMLPTSLLYSVAAARESIPFPAIVEGLIMEITFEALREAGVRLPKTIGQSVSILGALVIGTAAVEAGIVSAPKVIVVSITGIASFTIPRYNAAITIRMLRFPLMFMAASFGLFGMLIGVLLILVHLCQLRSFGVPYLSGIAPYRPAEQKDILFRAPWWKMVSRPGTYAKGQHNRMKSGMRPSPPDERS